MQFVTGPSLRRSGFDLRPVRVEFVDLVALGQNLSPRILVSTILPVFHTQQVMHLPPTLTGTVLETFCANTCSCLLPGKGRVYWSCRNRPITKFGEFSRRWHVILFQGVGERFPCSTQARPSSLFRLLTMALSQWPP